jgi:pyridoxal/pyridoxine/pyridoxamine kinase
MALEAEVDLAVVATANLTEAEVATEEHRHTEEHLVMALRTCINRPRMVVGTNSSSLNMACLSKVFQSQIVAIVGACSLMLGKC